MCITESLFCTAEIIYTSVQSKFFFLFITAPAAYGNSWAGVESELQLQAYTTAIATPYLSHISETYTTACVNARSLTQ